MIDEKGEGIKSSPNYRLTRAYCADCWKPVSAHPLSKDQQRSTGCYRSTSDVRYYEVENDDTSVTQPDFTYPFMEVTDYSGPASGSHNSEDTWDAMFEEREPYELVPDGWFDKHPEECTKTLEGTRPDPKAIPRPKPSPSSLNIVDQVRNVYVDGTDGFTSKVMVDEYITERFGQKLINAFIGKYDHKLHVGNITIDTKRDPRTGTSKVMAICSHDNCRDPETKKRRALVAPTAPTRSEMEDFVFAIIRHSNAHAPYWMLRDKPHAVYPSIGLLQGENLNVTANTVLI